MLGDTKITYDLSASVKLDEELRLYSEQENCYIDIGDGELGALIDFLIKYNGELGTWIDFLIKYKRAVDSEESFPQ